MKGYYDIVGDGGSDILEQVEAQQESIARSLSGVRNLLAVGSGKGGVGKTNVVANLALALTLKVNRVLIFDADIGLNNIDILLGLAPRYHIGHVFNG